MARSIFQDSKKCFICESQQNLENHHVFFGEKRDTSDKNGFVCYLCNHCHTGSNEAVHCKDGHAADLYLKQTAQRAYEKLGHTRQQFIELIGKSYL